MKLADYKELFSKKTKSWGVFAVLEDQQWHCRECEYRHLRITQIAGGAGIQGLQRGTKSRPGIEIKSANHFCRTCNKQTRQDKWNGQFLSTTQASSMPRSFAKKAMEVLKGRDVVEGTERPLNQLTVDHKLPRLRWNKATEQEQTAYASMTDRDIMQNFQLLKKSNGSVSHNLLKSRACERCFTTGKRGKPFGIAFYYEGESAWKPPRKDDPSGCVGCGWYDFDEWRKHLNKKVT